MAENFGGPPGTSLRFVFDRAWYGSHKLDGPPHPPNPLDPYGSMPMPGVGIPPPHQQPIRYVNPKTKRPKKKNMKTSAMPVYGIGPPPPPPQPMPICMMPPPPQHMPYTSNPLLDVDSPDVSEDETDDCEELIQKSEVMPIYASGDCNCNSCIDWSDDPPAWVEKEERKAKRINKLRGAYAIVHRQVRFNSNDGWQTHGVSINSEKLRDFLFEVTNGVQPGFIGPPGGAGGPLLSLFSPFSVLFHRHDRYEELLELETDPETKKEASLLLEILMQNWEPAFAAAETCRATNLISYRFLWTVLPPDELLAVPIRGRPSVAKLSSYLPSNRGTDCWNLVCEVVDWNGAITGYKRIGFNIDEYEGLRDITELHAYPMRFHSTPGKLRDDIVERGRKFESLRGYHYKAFCAKINEDSEPLMRERVIVDNYAYYKLRGKTLPTLRPIVPDDDDTEVYSISELSDGEDFEDVGRIGRAAIDIPEPASRSSSRSRSPSSEHKLTRPSFDRNEDFVPMSDEDCLLALPMMLGFCMRTKNWYEYDVSCLYDIVWNDSAFEQLVMDEGQKRLILAFTENHQSETGTRFDDFISGKGRGMTFLLCGPPGVGKTLTAESIAERTRAPLYLLSASELGASSSSLETGFQEALNRCTLWKSLLLIDEADVFMEERNVDSIERNSLVSVFLRLLEYYEGIMFLTTNRAKALDPAFESRIDLILPYADLDRAARRDIWANFITRMAPETHSISMADFDGLANVTMNGREIKSTVKTALVLARREGGVLTVEHVQTVLQLRQRATKYLRE